VKLILYSKDDVAGSNIARILVNGYGFRECGKYYYGSPIKKKGDILLVGTHSSVTNLRLMPLKAEVCVVASRHRSEAGTPSLTCHCTGNFTDAILGGRPQTLQLTQSQYLSHSHEILKELRDQGGLHYDVSLEVTHHGPTDINVPMYFLEVGSTRTQWTDENAVEAAASAIMKSLSTDPAKRISAIGFGGPHYGPNFNALTSKYGLGHIMPKYQVKALDHDMVQKMIDYTVPTPQIALIDWKGLRGEDKTLLTGILDDLGLAWEKTSNAK